MHANKMLIKFWYETHFLQNSILSNYGEIILYCSQEGYILLLFASLHLPQDDIETFFIQKVIKITVGAVLQ